MNDKIQIENYLDQKVNPLLEELLTQIIKNRPKNVLKYCRGWFQKKTDSINMFPELSDTDSEEEDTLHVERLLEKKNAAKWYCQRKGICGQVFGSNNQWDDFEVASTLRKSTVNNRILFRLKSLFLFKDFDDCDINRLIAAMTEVAYEKGRLIVHQGQNQGGDMYVIDSGQVEVIKGPIGKESLIKTLKEGELFGQMSMLYNMPRWASVRTKTNCVLFRLDRKTYHALVNEKNLRKRKMFQTSLKKVELFRELDCDQRYKLQDLIKEVPIHLNQYVIREGKATNMFYIVESGTFVSLKKEKNGHDKILGQYKQGDVFGDGCLFSKLPATQSVMSLTNGKLYAIERDGLQRVLGPISKLMKRSINIYEKYQNYLKG